MTDKNPTSCLPRHYAQWVKEQRIKQGLDPNAPIPNPSDIERTIAPTGWKRIFDKPTSADIKDRAADREWRVPGRRLNRP